MPLVFVHGVANRPSDEQAADIVQRNALFRSITFENEALTIFNPDWGSHAVSFTSGLPWLPDPKKIQAFAAGDADQEGGDIGLGPIAKIDGAQAVDLAVFAALENAVIEAGKNKQPDLAADKEVLQFAKAAADYLAKIVPEATADPKGVAELAGSTDQEFTDALGAELQSALSNDLQAFGVGDRIRDAVSSLGGWIGNGLSDTALRAKRRSLSQSTALFLGDIFVYLRQRKVEGPTGTAARLFEPILIDLVKAAKDKRAADEPFVVVGHSLGGVLLFDILTDETCLSRLRKEVPDFKIDALVTVGSQPGFFADLGLYPDQSKNSSGRFERPGSVENWFNVYDYTDVFSFLCKPFFEGVDDFGYDTKVDLLQAHSAYFKRPSFYKRLQARLKTLS